jgi:phosphatidylserine/phosphatidylglycerophosphate/cardiolipin synthase-like enzyme
MLADELLAEFVSSETPARIEALTDALASGRIGMNSPRVRVGLELPPGPQTVERAMSLLAAWSELSSDPSDATVLVAALRAASRVRHSVEERGPKCELAWTGPLGPYGVRTTDQAVAEMLHTAAREVLIVQYAINIAGASSAVLERLGELAQLGVRITLIVDAGWGDGWSVRSIRRNWPEATPRPRLYSYVVEDDELAKLHAKVLIVDERDLFVSSANLTGYGYGVNLEFGVRVQGEPARQAQVHFDHLIASDLLTEVDW